MCKSQYHEGSCCSHFTILGFSETKFSSTHNQGHKKRGGGGGHAKNEFIFLVITFSVIACDECFRFIQSATESG